MSTAASCSVSPKPRVMSTALLHHTQTALPADEEDTVWIGFMDIIPVIGMNKEAVDLVLALYEGNEEVIKEKEKALENIVEESLKTHVKLTPPAAVAPDDEFSGLRNVREIRKEMILECMLKGSKSGTKPPISPEQKERENKKNLEDIREDMLKKINILHPNLKPELTEELKRSRRGEHVFNNSILRFHSNVVTEFIKKRCIHALPGYDQITQELEKLGKHTLSKNTAAEIQTNMVVRFSRDEFYVNANGVVYGAYSKALSDALLDVLSHKYLSEVTKKEKEKLEGLLDNMNNLQIYVDKLAKDCWIAKTNDGEKKFEQVRQEVANMYSTKREYDWCNSIHRQVAPLFK